MRTSWGLLICLFLVSCAALRDDMRRAEGAFDQARYEDVEVWLSDLEQNVPEMDRGMRARFYYLRGMTAFRLGERSAARHYLALSREEAGPQFLGLRSEWRASLDGTLQEIDAPRDGSVLPAPRPAVNVDDERPPAVQP